jgi:hypothetical protein
MPQFRLADLDLRWTGIDGNTPAGHVVAVGLDPLGNTRVFLWRGDQPADDQFVGSLLIRDHATIAYGQRGSFVGAHGDQASLLTRLANIWEPAATTADHVSDWGAAR